MVLLVPWLALLTTNAPKKYRAQLDRRGWQASSEQENDYAEADSELSFRKAHGLPIVELRKGLKIILVIHSVLTSSIYVNVSKNKKAHARI